MKKCPYCAEDIQDEAVKCRFCGEWLNKKRVTDQVTNAIKNDINKAQYGEIDVGSSMAFPKAGKSITGWVFIVCGAIIGALVYALLLFAIEESGYHPFQNRDSIRAFIGLMFMCGGGFAGQLFHESLKDKLG